MTSYKIHTLADYIVNTCRKNTSLIILDDNWIDWRGWIDKSLVVTIQILLQKYFDLNVIRLLLWLLCWLVVAEGIRANKVWYTSLRTKKIDSGLLNNIYIRFKNDFQKLLTVRKRLSESRKTIENKAWSKNLKGHYTLVYIPTFIQKGFHYCHYGQWTCYESFFKISQIIARFGQKGPINCGIFGAFPFELSAC